MTTRIPSITRGLKFDGAVCRRCGGTLRYVSTRNCVACASAMTRRDEIRILESVSRAIECIENGYHHEALSTLRRIMSRHGN